MTGLLDATTNKILDKIEKNNRLRKEIINYTNNFREYKLLKSDIIERLLENENDFKQLNIIVKSLSNQSYLQKDQVESLNEKIFSLENELINSQASIEEMQKNNDYLNSENEEKDNFIHELLTKINFLENVVKDYRTRIYISKYDKMFSYKSPFKNDENLKKFYEKFLPTDYKYPFIHLSSKGTLGKKFDESPERLDKLKKETLKSLLKNRPKSSNHLIADIKMNNKNENNKLTPSISPDEKKNINTSLNKYFSLNGINLKKTNSKNSNLSIKNNSNEFSPMNNHNNNQNEENDFSNENNNQQQYIYEINNKSKNNFVDTEEACRKIAISSNGFKSTGEGNFQKELYHSSSNNFNEENFEQNNNLNSTNKKTSQEKERANFVSNLLLKIFSKPNVLRILKRKFGENFEIKLTDKEVDPNFVIILEEEVNELLKKEKQKEFMINERMEANKFRKKSRPSLIRSISPPNDGRENRKAFNNYTKNASGYFDPKYQYGGESKVPASTRSQSNERLGMARTGISTGKRRRDFAARSSMDLNMKRQSLGAGSVINELYTGIEK